MRIARYLLLFLASLSVAGCGKSKPASEVPQDPPGASSGAAAESNPDVALEILSFDEIQQRIADNQGSEVVVDCWSTSCPPCMKDFHNLVELHKEYPAEDLACVSLSFDYEGLDTPEETRPPVLEFLRSQGATFDNYMSNEESEALYRKFELNAVPAVFVYDRAGKLRQRFESEGAYDQVRVLVAELIKEPASTVDHAEANQSVTEPQN